MRLSQAVEGYMISSLADGYSPDTIRAYLSALKVFGEFLKDPEINTITETHLKQFFGYLRNTYKTSEGEPLSTASLHRYWKSCRSFFAWAERENYTDRPDLVIPMPKYNHKEVIPYTEEEIRKLIKACEYSATVKPGNRNQYVFARSTATRDKALILTLLDTGVRVGELCRLRMQDINLETGEISVRPHRIGKTRPRLIPLGKSARKYLWKYLNSRPKREPDDFVFEAQTGQPMTRYSVGALMTRLGKKTGIHAHPHKFRHTFAIQFLRNGGDVFTLQKLLGHATLTMVRHYLSIAQTDVEDAHKRASPADRWKL